MKISISKTNRKMGGIPSFSLPPVITCANCEQCSKKCYALKMARFHKSVGQAWENNLDAYKSNPDAVKCAILKDAYLSNYFRFFVGGDIVDNNFLLLMVDVANSAKNCNFLAFTKKYKIVNDYINAGGVIPNNLKIIFSEWDKPIPNPHNLPKSKVIFRGEPEPVNAKICGGNCFDCICKGVACWSLENNDTIYFYEH